MTPFWAVPQDATDYMICDVYTYILYMLHMLLKNAETAAISNLLGYLQQSTSCDGLHTMQPKMLKFTALVPSHAIHRVLQNTARRKYQIQVLQLAMKIA